MRNQDRWVESKYVRRGGRLRASRDLREVGIGSRLVSDLIAARYEAHVPAFARGRLIDLGCGLAPLFGAYRGHVDTVTCVDWPQSPHADRYVDHLVDLGGRLPFGDGAFDTVILSDVLEHLPSPETVWAEMARLVAPGGHVLLNVPFLYGIHEAPHDYARYTEFGLRRLAERSGFAVLLLEPLGGSLHVLADLVAKHLAHLPVLGHPLAWAAQTAVGLLDRTAVGRRLARYTGSRFPLGYFMVACRPADPRRSEAPA